MVDLGESHDIDGERARLAEERLQLEAARRRQSQRVRELKQEVRQIRRMIGELSEATADYAQLRVQETARRAIDRYPVGSLAIGALVGYLLASRR